MTRYERILECVNDALDRARVRALRNGNGKRAWRFALICGALDEMANRAFMRRMERYRDGI